MNTISMLAIVTTIKELEGRRTYLSSQIDQSHVDNKKVLQKEIVKINSIVSNLTDYKICYIDQQPEKEPRQKKKKEKEEVSYGIMQMINK